MVRAFFVLILGALILSAGEFAQRCIEESYPEVVLKIAENRIYFRDGSSLEFDDGHKKSYAEAFVHADLEDSFWVAYPLKFGDVAPRGKDTSRLRDMRFFKKVYGDSEALVRKNIVRIPWLAAVQSGVFVEVHALVAEKIARISKRIELLSPEIYKVAMQSAGGFNWRNIAGSEVLSVHSFGIALDLDVRYSHYWLWDMRKGRETYSNAIPREIVEIFETEGFIWGGKWGHYDTMHFEYRPEILCYAKMLDDAR
ncbi:MAG: M15 family metallopeptidase [Wolinella sp.]